MLQHGKRPTIASRHGMVAAAHPLAAAAGARILGNGGNAFDAAAATAATLNVVEPYMSGLAGMGMATCYVASERRVRSLNFMSLIPRKFPLEKLNSREQIVRGPVPVGSPGNLAGWCEMVSTYGTKKLPELFAPAIAVARDGFGLIEFNVEEIGGVTYELRGKDKLYPEWSRTYLEGIGGGRPALGAVLKQPDLANTLEALAAEGPGLMYGGALGKKVVERLAELGGTLTMDDLMDFKVQWIDPVAASYRGRTIHVPPPPCEAFQYLLALRILEGFDLGKLPRNGTEHIDTVLRAIRIAAGVRIANGVPSQQKLAELLSDGHVESLRARVRDGKPVVGPTEQWTPPANEGHTTSFSIADKHGNMVCVTQSLGSVFGSGVVVPGTGVCLNNFLYWADVNPKSPNRVKHRRRHADLRRALDRHRGRQAGAGAGHARQLRHPADPGAGDGAVRRFRPAVAAGDRGAARAPHRRPRRAAGIAGRRRGARRAAHPRPRSHLGTGLDDEGRRHAGRGARRTAPSPAAAIRAATATACRLSLQRTQSLMSSGPRASGSLYRARREVADCAARPE